jgi:hypothetical protein
MNPNTAPLISQHRAPKGEDDAALTQHYRVYYLRLPATDWADWDAAREKAAKKGGR